MKLGITFYVVLAFCLLVTLSLTVFTQDKTAFMTVRIGMFILLSILSVVMALAWSSIANKIGKLFSGDA